MSKIPITPKPNLSASFAASLCFSRAFKSSFHVTTLSRNLTSNSDSVDDPNLFGHYFTTIYDKS